MSKQPRKCRQSGCTADAYAIAHWPGQDTEQCERHCKEMAVFYQSMWGRKLLFTDLVTGQTLELRSEPSVLEGT